MNVTVSLKTSKIFCENIAALGRRDKMKWGSEDVSGIRHRLTVNITLLTAFNKTLTR